MKVKQYTYEFGIDSVNALKLVQDSKSCFVSKEIRIGDLLDDEYLQISSDCDQKGGSIEFYVIDGIKEIAILPVEFKEISNEKIFYSLRPRFSIDKSKNVVIKKNGSIVNTTIDQAINNNSGEYTITYVPMNPYNIKTSSSEIKIKIIMRAGSDSMDSPVINSVVIKKFGRNSIWKNKS